MPARTFGIAFLALSSFGVIAEHLGEDHCECTGPCPQYGKWTCHYANGTIDEKYKYGDKADCVDNCHSTSMTAPAASQDVPVHMEEDHCECTGPCPQYGKWTCHYANGTIDEKYKYGDKADCAANCHSTPMTAPAALQDGPMHCITTLSVGLYKKESSDWCEQFCVTPVLVPAVRQFGDVEIGFCKNNGYPKYDHTQNMKLFKVDLYKSSSDAASSSQGNQALLV